MKIIPTRLAGVLVFEPTVYRDDRGFFVESYQRQRYADAFGRDIEFVQDNHSHSRRGVLRGLHFQRRQPQGKLVHVVAGHVWDVAVDIDPSSSTFKQWVAVDLTAESQRQMYVPPGYAHGFCVLSEVADVVYKCTEYYRPGDEVGVLWSDPDLAIEWPLTEPVLSQRDATNPTLEDCLSRLA